MLEIIALIIGGVYAVAMLVLIVYANISKARLGRKLYKHMTREEAELFEEFTIVPKRLRYIEEEHYKNNK